MEVLALAIEKPYWQDVMSKARELGLPVTAAVVHYRDSDGPNHFFSRFSRGRSRASRFTGWRI